MDKLPIVNKKIVRAISFLIVALLLVSVIAGTIVYYNNKIADLNSQISKLNAVIENYPTAHLETSLETTEKLNNESTKFGTPALFPYNYLYITGSVSNTGQGAAFNVGLQVVAYTATGILEINMTVPPSIGIYAANDFILKNIGGGGWATRTQVLYGEQTETYIAITIYHEGTITNWTVTPVWTNTP